DFHLRLKSELLRKAVLGEAPQGTAVGAASDRSGLPSVAPFLFVRGADNLLGFLKRAFFAEEVAIYRGKDGTIAHGQLRIGDMALEMGEAHGQFEPNPSAFHIYVADAEPVYRRALQSGATSLYEPTDMPYGDREGAVVDPAGNRWFIGARKQAEAAQISPVPEGFHTVTPYLTVRRAEELLEFVKTAFGAVELMRATGSAGGLHAEVRIGSSVIMLGGYQALPRESPATLYLYVPDVDAIYEQAVRAGATPVYPPTEQPYGDRNAHVEDPFGNTWYIATRIKDMR
ncbi:MAG TPA: VOC family protein, partial [Acidobacteriota bacterium]|nr:VOC family protein [Acidobacteriota bacterium]